MKFTGAQPCLLTYILSVAVFRLLWQKLSSREKPKIFCSLALYGKNVLTRGGMAKAPYPPPGRASFQKGVCVLPTCAFMLFLYICKGFKMCHMALFQRRDGCGETAHMPAAWDHLPFPNSSSTEGMAALCRPWDRPCSYRAEGHRGQLGNRNTTDPSS